MKIFLLLLSFFYVYVVFSQDSNYTNIDAEEALILLAKIEGVQFNDSAITYAFKHNDIAANLYPLIKKDENEQFTLDYEQLHPLYTEALRALYFRNQVLENQLQQMEVTIENLNIEINNKLNEVNYKIYSIENEIKP